MQRMDSLDSPKKKLVFKKRSHRPWNSPVEESTRTILEYNNKVNSFDNNRLLIGGFSFPTPSLSSYECEQSAKSLTLLDELKNKEQQIQELSSNLKIASALEHVEKIELSRSKEILARQAAEEKALFATQQVNLVEEQLQKARQQIQIEQQLKTKESSIRYVLETEIKNALATIEENENTIAHEVELRKIAEEKLNETLNFLSEKENTLRLEAEKILEIQTEAFQKITEAEEKTQQYAKTNIKTEELLQKSEIIINQIESEKTILEQNLAAEIQYTREQKLEFEAVIKNYENNIHQLDEKINNITIANLEFKKQLLDTTEKLNATEKSEIESAQKINNLNLQIKSLTETAAALSTEKVELTRQLTDSLGKAKLLENIGNKERQLRTLLEEKLNDSYLRKIELNKKLFENKVIDLAERIARLEIEKSEIKEKHVDALEDIQKIQIFMSAETTIKESLEEKNKVITEQATQLEIALNNEKSVSKNLEEALSIVTKQQYHLEHAKFSTEEKLDQIYMYVNELEFKLNDEKIARTRIEKNLKALSSQKQKLDEEKEVWEEKFTVLKTNIISLEETLATEKALRINAEQLKASEEHARKIAQEKIATLEKTNKTILNVLGNYTTSDATNAEI